jgi:cell division protein FtsA
MRDSQPNHYFGLDIGTNTVRCVVGMDNSENPMPSIIGYGEAPNLGMRKGVVVHVDDVIESVIHAIGEAERVSGIQIHRATTNVNGTNVTGINSQGVIAISAANREITMEDAARVEEAATIIQLPPNKEIIQVFAKNYRLDGQDDIKDPVGMQGIRLEVDSHIITASVANLKNLTAVLEGAKVGVNHLTVSGLAAAEAVLNRQQKESGTLLLDIGAGTTNLAVLEDGEIQYVGVIPVGGINITNDLAIGLKTDLDIAEKVKIQHASLEEKAKTTTVQVEHEKKRHTFYTDEIHMVVEARLDELLDYVDKELHKIHRSRKLPGGVVITGGTSKLPGIAAFTREKLQLPARLGRVQKLHGVVDTVQDPGYTTAVGLMMLDMLLGNTDSFQGLKTKGKTNVSNLTNKLFGRFK